VLLKYTSLNKKLHKVYNDRVSSNILYKDINSSVEIRLFQQESLQKACIALSFVKGFALNLLHE